MPRVRGADRVRVRPVPFTALVGTLLYLLLGAVVDAAVPGAHLLGANLRGLAFSTACLAAALWIGVRFELLE